MLLSSYLHICMRVPVGAFVYRNLIPAFYASILQDNCKYPFSGHDTVANLLPDRTIFMTFFSYLPYFENREKPCILKKNRVNKRKYCDFHKIGVKYIVANAGAGK